MYRSVSFASPVSAGFAEVGCEQYFARLHAGAFTATRKMVLVSEAYNRGE